MWQYALKLEMSNVAVAQDNDKLPPGYRRSNGHIIWDLRIEFNLKARWVKDGHRTPDPESSKYTGVVSRDSICTTLIYAALH